MCRRVFRGFAALPVAAALTIAACNRTPTPPPAQSTEPGNPAQSTEPGKPTPPQPSVQPALPPEGQPVNPDAKAMEALLARVNDYVAVHQKLADTLPKLSTESTPDEIDRNQRALARLIQKERRGVKPGALFTPDVQPVIKRLLDRVFSDPDGAALRASIMDENPVRTKLAVNSRYPDSVPLSTVPPQVLQGLPRLPAEMEFRFIGRHLILMDVHAHIIVDLIENALPA